MQNDGYIYFEHNGVFVKISNDGSEVHEIEKVHIDNSLNEPISDGKYLYYLNLDFTNGKGIFDYSVRRSDLDGKNEEILYKNIQIYSKLFLYDNCLYLKSIEDGWNIIKIDAEGNMENVTGYTDNFSKSLNILKVYDGKIYYNYTDFKNPKIYSINIDGTDNKIIYPIKDKSMEYNIVENQGLYTLFDGDENIIISDVAFIRFIGNNRFFISYTEGDNNYYSLTNIKGEYIIPKTKNYMIYLGYGKFVKFDGPFGNYTSRVF